MSNDKSQPAIRYVKFFTQTPPVPGLIIEASSVACSLGSDSRTFREHIFRPSKRCLGVLSRCSLDSHVLQRPAIVLFGGICYHLPINREGQLPDVRLVNRQILSGSLGFQVLS